MSRFPSLKELLLPELGDNQITEAKDSKGVDINALGQALNNDWGRSSTGRSHKYSVKGTTNGQYVMLTFSMIVNMVAGADYTAMTKEHEKESKKITSDALKEIKNAYKKLAGKTLGIKEVDSSTTLEYISVSNAKRTAYFRRLTRYELT